MCCAAAAAGSINICVKKNLCRYHLRLLCKRRTCSSFSVRYRVVRLVVVGGKWNRSHLSCTVCGAGAKSFLGSRLAWSLVGQLPKRRRSRHRFAVTAAGSVCASTHTKRGTTTLRVCPSNLRWYGMVVVVAELVVASCATTTTTKNHLVAEGSIFDVTGFLSSLIRI